MPLKKRIKWFSLAIFLTLFLLGTDLYFNYKNLISIQTWNQQKQDHEIAFFYDTTTLLTNNKESSQLIQLLDLAIEQTKIQYYILSTNQNLTLNGTGIEPSLKKQISFENVVFNDNLIVTGDAEYWVAIKPFFKNDEYWTNLFYYDLVRTISLVFLASLILALLLIPEYFFQYAYSKLGSVILKPFVKYHKSWHGNPIFPEEFSLEEEKTIPAALQLELFSGKNPPYQFEAVCVLFSVENYFEFLEDSTNEKLMEKLELLFNEIIVIIDKYNGHIKSFGENSISFYFKQEECPQPWLNTLGCLFEINSTYSSTRLKKQFDYPFVFRASANKGKVTFKHQVNSFILLGIPFALNHLISIKTNLSKSSHHQFLISANKTDLDQLKITYELEPISEIYFINSNSIIHIHSQTPIEQVLPQIVLNNLYTLNAYRKTDDILFILTYLTNHVETLDQTLFIAITNQIKAFKAPSSSPDIQPTYQDLIKAIGQLHIFKESEKFIHYLSSVISICPSIIPKNEFDQSTQNLFKSYMALGDKRLTANVIEAFNYYDVGNENDFLAEVYKIEDNRVTANLLIKEGRKKLTRSISGKIDKMLKSDSPFQIASGLFALGELYKIYLSEKKAKEFNNIHFQTLAEKLPTFIESDSNMIRKQALQAIAKSKSSILYKEVIELYEQSHSENLKKEIELYFLQDQFSVYKKAA